MTTPTETSATPTIHSLRDPHATRVGQVHYVHFVHALDGSIVVLVDDCGFEDRKSMDAAAARVVYREWLDRGLEAYVAPYPAQVLRRAA